MLACLQDFGQLKEVYGDNQAKSMLSMVGTHVVCKVQAGETREEVARLLGKNKVAWRTHDDKATTHEESRGVVSANDLTDRLGFRKGKKMGPHGFGIRAIVQTSGDPLLLDFPGVVLPDKRPGQVAANWTKGPAGPTSSTPPQPKPQDKKETERVFGLSMDDLKAEMDRIYGEE